MALREQLNEDMKSAMKAREAEKLGAIRLLLAAVKQREVDERVTLDDAGVIGVVEKMIKQRKDSIAQYEKGARQDLADKEKFEIGILEAYLPQQLSQSEIDAIIAEALSSTGAKSGEKGNGGGDSGKGRGPLSPARKVRKAPAAWSGVE